jgi:LmbE family N-acetylglucosaminyl deacetylase
MNILVIVPHADDEVASCGGSIRKWVNRGDNVDLVVAGMGWGNTAARERELELASRILGIRSYIVLFPTQESYLDIIPQSEFVSCLDAIATQDYDTVIYPCPGHHHHDHVALHNACHAAFRLGVRIENPSLIAMYEYVYPGWMEFAQPFGKMYADITETIEVKVRAMRAYESQISRHSTDHPLNPESLKKLAQARGLESGYKYAEMFYIARMLA